MAAHTPGPFWTADILGVVRDSNGDEITRCTVRVNAALIAAAPDLLAALREAMPHLEAYYGQGYQSAIVVNARAAIAKAEGE